MFHQNSPRLIPLAFRLLIVLLGVVVGGNAQSASTAEWALGMNLKLFITTSRYVTTCPPTLHEANEDTRQVLPIFSSTALVAGGAPPDSTGSTSFRLTNGWVSFGGLDFTSQTTITAAEPNAVGGGCWFFDSDGSVVIAPCGTDRRFQFYVWAKSGAGPHELLSCNLTRVGPRQGAMGGPLIEDFDIIEPNICVYDVLTELVVIPPPANNFFPMSQITNLTGASIPPPSAPATEADLPVCNSDDSDLLGTPDCAIAKAVNGMPPGCDANPDLLECILHLFPAFCSDILAVRTGIGNVDEEVERCMRGISQGPCVANPSGAACASGLFPGISFVGGGGGSSGKRDVSVDLGDIGSFFLGVFKSLFNTAVGLVTLESSADKSFCIVLSNIQFELKLVKSILRIHDYCKNLFTKPGLLKPLEYDNRIEHAGGLVTDIVLLLIPVVDLAVEAKAATLLDTILAKFVATSAKEVLAEGEFLEAQTVGGDVVRIFKNKGDGTPTGLHGELETEGLKESIRETGFQNCIEAVASAQLVRRAPKKTLLCDLAAKVVEKPTSEWAGPSKGKELKPAIPLEGRVIGDLIEIPGIVDAEKTLLTKLGEEFTAFYKTGQPGEVVADDITNAFFEARTRGVDQRKIVDTARDLYGLRKYESYAMNRWMYDYDIVEPGLVSGLKQMDAAVTPVLRVTELSPNQIEMLETVAPGIKSGGPPGVYKLEDLVWNQWSEYVSTSKTPGPQPNVMASHVGMRIQYELNSNYRFVIQSKAGRYITPAVRGTREDEIVFIDGIAGEFKLLGRQDLNGGAAAREAGKPGPYSVFYFEEINPPPLEPPPRFIGSKQHPNRAIILTPPTFP